jgi:hypothetical protein
MKNPIRNQRGIALVATLILLVLGFGVVTIMFRLVTQDTKLATLEQGYTATLDAAKAGADLFIDMAQRQTPVPPQPNNGPVNAFGTSPNNGQCLNVKMFNPTTSAVGTWATNAGWAGCPPLADATSTDPTDNPDITFTLNAGAAGATATTVNVKIINTYQSGATGIQNPNNCQFGCYYYTVISRAQPVGSKEYSEVFYVYRYDK